MKIGIKTQISYKKKVVKRKFSIPKVLKPKIRIYQKYAKGRIQNFVFGASFEALDKKKIEFALKDIILLGTFIYR